MVLPKHPACAMVTAESRVLREHSRIRAAQGAELATSVLYMSMSLDGYIAGPNDEPGNPGGDDFGRLHEWFVSPRGEFFRPAGAAAELVDEIKATTAVLSGRRTVEQVDHWKGDHHGVPIFVPSHRPPGPTVASYPLVTYVSDGIASAMAQAKAAAGDGIVLVHGAYTGQRAIEAGVLDELQISQIPVLFGGGRRLFDVLPRRVELEIVRVIDTPEATHIRYRIRR
jgi:dihydrofolate reductase